MTPRVVKLTVVNDFVSLFPSLRLCYLNDRLILQVCANCCIGQYELLTAISHCMDTLHLPLSFELEHIPFRLISPECLSDDVPASAKVDKSTFYKNRLGKDRFATVESTIAKWAKEKGIPMYVVRLARSFSERVYVISIPL